MCSGQTRGPPIRAKLQARVVTPDPPLAPRNTSDLPSAFFLTGPACGPPCRRSHQRLGNRAAGKRLCKELSRSGTHAPNQQLRVGRRRGKPSLSSCPCCKCSQSGPARIQDCNRDQQSPRRSSAATGEAGCQAQGMPRTLASFLPAVRPAQSPPRSACSPQDQSMRSRER